ncbi:oxidoreductase [Streptomyces sp. NPDC023723]|uniref:oxidoreductase n=1 Tax=Streptomyces sp. NPDC023723 TaxID=3154323 RepID=UPI0033F38305
MLSYDELTPPEREVWHAFPSGRTVNLHAGPPGDDPVADGARWGPERTVRAAVLAALLLGAHSGQPGTVPALRLAGARISGPLDLAGAQLAYALWLAECWFEESVDLSGASAQSIAITGSAVPGVEAGLIRVDGRLDLGRSRIGTGPATPFHRRVTALSLINAHVSGAVNLKGAELTAAGEWAVSAGGLVAEGGLYCVDGFVAHGEVRLMGAQLPGGLHLRGALLDRPGPRGVVLALDNAVTSTLDCSGGFVARGTVRLRGARVADDLTFAGAVLDGPADGAGPSLSAPLLTAVDFDLTLARPPSGAVDLRGAQVAYLHDNEHSWPAAVELDGFVYGAIRADRDRNSVAERVAWLRRGPGYHPQPYEQLASWYRKAGHDDEARRVLLAKQRHRRRTLRPAGRAWGHLLDATVGYGYRPWLAGLWLLALTALGTLSFRTGTPVPVKAGEGVPFQPLVYTLDLLVPIGGLGQRTAWYWPDGDGRQWLAHLLIALGWVLTTSVVAGVTRALQKN